MEQRIIRSLAELDEVKAGEVLVDRQGVAYQATQIGSDLSHVKGGRDTRRTVFWQAGNLTMFEAYALVPVLPFRVVDDGHAGWDD